MVTCSGRLKTPVKRVRSRFGVLSAFHQANTFSCKRDHRAALRCRTTSTLLDHIR